MTKYRQALSWNEASVLPAAGATDVPVDARTWVTGSAT